MQVCNHHYHFFFLQSEIRPFRYYLGTVIRFEKQVFVYVIEVQKNGQLKKKLQRS